MFLLFRGLLPVPRTLPLKRLGKSGNNGRHPWHRDTILALGPSLGTFRWQTGDQLAKSRHNHILTWHRRGW
jgi:hypothetical protein